LAHLYCGETAACIKMPLGMELGLGPGDFVLDGDPAPPSPNSYHQTRQWKHSKCTFQNTNNITNAGSIMLNLQHVEHQVRYYNPLYGTYQ